MPLKFAGGGTYCTRPPTSVTVPPRRGWVDPVMFNVCTTRWPVRVYRWQAGPIDQCRATLVFVDRERIIVGNWRIIDLANRERHRSEVIGTEHSIVDSIGKGIDAIEVRQRSVGKRSIRVEHGTAARDRRSATK